MRTRAILLEIAGTLRSTRARRSVLTCAMTIGLLHETQHRIKGLSLRLIRRTARHSGT